MKVGDKVRIREIPRTLVEGEMCTRSEFEKCRGGVFRVESFDPGGWVELDVSRVTGSKGEWIYIEPEYLEVLAEE